MISEFQSSMAFAFIAGILLVIVYKQLESNRNETENRTNYYTLFSQKISEFQQSIQTTFFELSNDNVQKATEHKKNNSGENDRNIVDIESQVELFETEGNETSGVSRVSEVSETTKRINTTTNKNVRPTETSHDLDTLKFFYKDANSINLNSTKSNSKRLHNSVSFPIEEENEVFDSDIHTMTQSLPLFNEGQNTSLIPIRDACTFDAENWESIFYSDYPVDMEFPKERKESTHTMDQSFCFLNEDLDETENDGYFF